MVSQYGVGFIRQSSNDLSISRTSAELFAASQARTSRSSRSRSWSAIDVATYWERRLAATPGVQELDSQVPEAK